MLKVDPSSEIFIFGFSRGAYAARHVAGMVTRRGIEGFGTFNPEYQWLNYRESAGTPLDYHRYPVQFLGLFDCVPANDFENNFLRFKGLNSENLEPGILNFRHAVAENERRYPFRPLIFASNEEPRSFQQVWFPGYHRDVGGGVDDYLGGKLSSSALLWMLQEANRCGFEIRQQCIHEIMAKADLNGPFHPSDDLSTKLGFRFDRRRRVTSNMEKRHPILKSLDICPICGLSRGVDRTPLSVDLAEA